MHGRAAGRIDSSGHGLTFFEQRVDAMLCPLADAPPSSVTIGALPHAIDDLPPAQYDALTHCERGVHGMRPPVLENGLPSEAEISEHLARQDGPSLPHHI